VDILSFVAHEQSIHQKLGNYTYPSCFKKFYDYRSSDHIEYKNRVKTFVDDVLGIEAITFDEIVIIDDRAIYADDYETLGEKKWLDSRMVYYGIKMCIKESPSVYLMNSWLTTALMKVIRNGKGLRVTRPQKIAQKTLETSLIVRKMREKK
jgi:hypothetical protein